MKKSLINVLALIYLVDNILFILFEIGELKRAEAKDVAYFVFKIILVIFIVIVLYKNSKKASVVEKPNT